MDEKELISKLSALKNVQPRSEWVLLTKQRILSEESIPQPMPLPEHAGPSIMGQIASVFRYLALEKPAFGVIGLALLMVVGIGLSAVNSVPGETLYSLKSAMEKAQLSLVPQKDGVQELQVAQRRLDDLKKVVETNKVQNLSPAIKEFETSVSGASKSLVKITEKEPQKALQAGKDILQLQKEKERLEQVLGTSLGVEETKELTNATKRLVEIELDNLTTRTLTDTQLKIFIEAKAAYEEGNYNLALEHIILLSQNVEH